MIPEQRAPKLSPEERAHRRQRRADRNKRIDCLIRKLHLVREVVSELTGEPAAIAALRRHEAKLAARFEIEINQIEIEPPKKWR